MWYSKYHHRWLREISLHALVVEMDTRPGKAKGLRFDLWLRCYFSQQILYNIRGGEGGGRDKMLVIIR